MQWPGCRAGCQGFDRPPGVLLSGSQERFSLVRVLVGARRCVATRPVIASAHGQVAGFSGAVSVRLDQPAGGVQHAVAQRLGLGFGQVPSRCQELEPGEKDCPVIAAVQPRSYIPKSKNVL